MHLRGSFDDTHYLFIRILLYARINKPMEKKANMDDRGYESTAISKPLV